MFPESVEQGNIGWFGATRLFLTWFSIFPTVH
jgi:hypothetical protein